MESIDDSNSTDMFDDCTNDNRRNRNSMEECSRVEDESDVSNKEAKDKPSSGTSRKINFQSVPRGPKVGVQEKIIICIENSLDKGLGYQFSDLDENTKEPNTHAIRNEAIRMFIVNKVALAKDTEFAIASVEPGKLNWLSPPFTSNLNKLSESLSEYKCVFNVESSSNLDLTSIFSEVLTSIDIPEYTNNVTIIPPNYVIRVILLYSNSYLVPHVNTKDPSYLKFVLSPCCFLDVFYLHEKQSDFNYVDRIYQEFGKIVSPSSYLLESSRDVTQVFNNAVKLLAHPNQRVVESMWKF